MIAPIKLTIVLTHPIQYYAPWFRDIHAGVPDIDLTVVYAVRPTAEQQGVGFDRAFEWDTALTDGYRSLTVRPAAAGERIDADHFFGVDVRDIGQAIADTAPDVVMIGGWYSVTLVRALLECRRLGVPVLWRGDSHLHSGPRRWIRPLWMLKTAMLLRGFDGFLSPGVRTSEYLRWFGIPEHKIFRVPHSVDNDMFAASAAPHARGEGRAAARRRWGIDEGAFVPIFVGKLIASKRPLDAVRAVARLAPAATLMIVGSGPLEEDMRAEAASLGVDLRLIGFLNQSELGELYGLADCLVLPSTFPETWGLVVNEALAAGLPCVVSAAVGCAPELIRDDENGYVFPLDDVGALATALSRVRDRIADGHDWRPACQAHIARYNFREMTVGLARATRSVLRRSRGQQPSSRAASPRIVACCGQMVIAGGLERMTFEMLDAARSGGATVHAIVNGWENFRITALAEAAGASWSVGPYWYALRRRRLTPLVAGRMLLEVVRVSAHLLRVSRQIRPTHIVVPDFEAVLRNAPALFWLRLRRVQVVMRLGNAPEPQRFYRLLWRHVIGRFVDRFVPNSQFTGRELLRHGITGDRVLTIPNRLSRRATGWHSDAPRVCDRVIFVGQIIPGKGVDLLLEAIAILRTRGIGATLDVVGAIDGWESPSFLGYREKIRERAAQPDLAGCVNFLGWREDVPALLSRAAVHCCPSTPQIRESFGNVVLEAKASGVPSVVTDSGGLPELISHRCDGWICSAATANALAEGLEYFLRRPDVLAAAGRAAQASAARYSEQRFVNAWRGVFGIMENA